MEENPSANGITTRETNLSPSSSKSVSLHDVQTLTGIKEISNVNLESGNEKSLEPNLIQRKKKLSKDQHVHFTFDDFHYYSSQDEKSIQPRFHERNEIEETESEIVLSQPFENVDSFTAELNQFEVSEETQVLCLGYSKRQWAILIVFIFAETISAIIISLPAPLFPPKADEKGVTKTEVGVLFGAFELTVFLISPILGRHMGRIGSKLAFNFGIFLIGTCAIFFGLLDKVESRILFSSFSLVILIVEALGDAAFLTASYTIVLCEFPQLLGTTFAFKEIFFGVGLVLGPAIGCGLYEILGFMYTFLLMGGLLLTIAFLTYILLPDNNEFDTTSSESLSWSGIKSLIKIPSVALTAFTVFGSALSIGFLTPTLEPHLRQFGNSPVITGLVFIISGGVYAITSPIWGWICDKFQSPQLISIFGSLLILVGFLLIGPAPFFPIEPTLELTATGLAVHGVGLGMALVSSFRQALKQTLRYDFPDNIETYGLVSSLWTTFFSIGTFVGPIIAGVLHDFVGFRLGIWVILGNQIFLILVAVGFLLCDSDFSDSGSKSLNMRRKVSTRNKGTEREYLLG